MCVDMYLYIISGEQTKTCEKIKLDLENFPSTPIASVNDLRINSGVCQINEEFIYVFYGEGSINSIERLNLSSQDKWEMINANYDGQIGLKNFTCFSFGTNIVFFGGENSNGERSTAVYYFDATTNNIKLINVENINEQGEMIGPSGLFTDMCIQIEEDLFSNFDIKGNLHVFNKLLGLYQVFKNNAC